MHLYCIQISLRRSHRYHPQCTICQHRMMDAGASEWKSLVFPFRSLRESLTSHQSDDHALTIAVFELAADVCLRAGDHSEFLKSCQQLMGGLYPTARHLSPAAVPLCAENNARGGQRAAIGDGFRTRPQLLLAREAEMAGLWLLYFICVPAAPEVRAYSFNRIRLQSLGQSKGKGGGGESCAGRYLYSCKRESLNYTQYTHQLKSKFPFPG